MSNYSASSFQPMTKPFSVNKFVCATACFLLATPTAFAAAADEATSTMKPSVAASKTVTYTMIEGMEEGSATMLVASVTWRDGKNAPLSNLVCSAQKSRDNGRYAPNGFDLTFTRNGYQVQSMSLYHGASDYKAPDDPFSNSTQYDHMNTMSHGDLVAVWGLNSEMCASVITAYDKGTKLDVPHKVSVGSTDMEPIRILMKYAENTKWNRMRKNGLYR